MNKILLLEAIFSTNIAKRQFIEKKNQFCRSMESYFVLYQKAKTNKQKEATNKTKYSRMDQVKFVEDSL